MLSWRSCPSSPSTGGDTTGVSSAVARLEERLSELAGAPVELERPNDPAHGDYATNVALRLAPPPRPPPPEPGQEGATAAARPDQARPPRGARPRVVQPLVAAA